jgi:hypothetical protein
MIPSDDLIQEVPAPLSHWYGDGKIAEENEALLANKRILRTLDNPPRWAFWRKNELRESEKILDALNKALSAQGIEPMLEALKALNEETQRFRVQMYNLKQDYKRSHDNSHCEELRKQAKVLRENMASVHKDKVALLRKLRPHRAIIQKRDKVAARIQEHYAAVAEAREEALRTRDMDKESRLIAERIILALNKLGFYHKRTKRDFFGNVMEIKEMCRFERIITTPDKVILKLDVSRLGLLGGHVDLLPHGVYSQDLVQERVLIHLQTALELPISSPNVTMEADWYQGVWFVVDRLGIPDGLETKISYKTVMKRYPEAKRHLMPVPMGVRSGRRINWIFLANQPHLLVNGVTGFGKSNAMQMFISTLVSKHSPDDVRFIIADMKNNGDFRWFVDLPHIIDSAYNIEKALELTHALYLEMKRRQKVIAEITNDISKYNSMVAAVDKMPHIFYVFDEYPAITINRSIANRIHEFSAHIAMQGRAVGIHMFPSGQQSYRDDFPRQLLANITFQFTARQNTVSGAMATTGSRETLNMKPIAGRFLCTSSHERYQVQMPYIEDEDIEACCDDARRWPEPNPFALPDVPRDEDTPPEPQRDPIELVLEVAFEHLDGALKARPIWEQLNGALSMPKTTSIVKQLAGQESVEWQGKFYEAIKQKGNFYRLIEIETPGSNPEELEQIPA